MCWSFISIFTGSQDCSRLWVFKSKTKTPFLPEAYHLVGVAGIDNKIRRKNMLEGAMYYGKI